MLAIHTPQVVPQWLDHFGLVPDDGLDDDSNTINGSDPETLRHQEGENVLTLATLLAATSIGTPSNGNSSRSPRISRPSLCTVCNARAPYSRGRKWYPTCGLICAAQLKAAGTCVICKIRPQSSQSSRYSRTCGPDCAKILLLNRIARSLCVICNARPSHSGGQKQFITCSAACATKLITNGAPQNMCDYCHKEPKDNGSQQCGPTCKQKAQLACLLCRSQPKLGQYHFCGKFCRDIARRKAPLILEAKPGHVTFQMVITKFTNAWKGSAPPPQVKRVYKVVESLTFLSPYDTYRRKHGNECFRYHGTSRQCRIGDQGHTELCRSATCCICSIIRTSFQVNLARNGAFGKGIYTSSAPNKAAGYASNGVMIVAKAVLGKTYLTNGWNQVMSCPFGYNSVVFERNSGTLNETIVYTNDAIRPVFLIVFG